MIATLDKTKISCYHCGDFCASEVIRLENKVFCCQGCLAVYELLNEHSLCEYYALQEHPGKKSESTTERYYAFLHNQKIIGQLIDFEEGQRCSVSFYIPSIHCSSCIWLLENLQKIQPGVIQSTVSFPKKRITVQFNKEVLSLAQLVVLLDSIGYRPEITLEGKKVDNASVHRTLLYKIGIAGFCFGNIMLLSMPEYVSFFGDFNGPYKVFFSYLSLLLSLPVFFYSASDYFISSWNSIKSKVMTIDLPIALGLVAAFVQSLTEIISNSGMGYLDSLTGLVFFLLIGKWYQQKTYDAISFERDYKSYFPMAATVIKDQVELTVPLNELLPGDIILVRNQDILPADGFLKQGKASIDYSFVTGEAALVSKHAGERLFAGGRQAGENILVELTKSSSESYLTQLWNTNRQASVKASGLTQFVNKVASYFTVAVLLLGIGTYIFWYLKEPELALHAAVSVLIIFCPCTLALAIPFCFGYAVNILGRNGFFCKNTHTIEKISDVETIVFDKTGTVTYSRSSDVLWQGELTDKEEDFVKSLVSHSSHPLSRAIDNYLNLRSILPVTDFKEHVSHGISGRIHGHELRMGAAAFIGLKPSTVFQQETEVYVCLDGRVRGRFVFKNKYREAAPDVLRALDRKYSLHLLSGDNDAEREMMQHYFPPAQIHFQQSPTDKLNYIRSLEQSKATLMVGDGLNDAGALMESTCGVAVSESAGHFSPACDAILDAAQWGKLPSFIAFSKGCLTVVRISLLVSLSYNVLGLYFACQGMLQPLVAAILMPASSLSVVLFVTFATNRLAKRHGLT